MHYQAKVQQRECIILSESTGELLNVLVEGTKYKFISTHDQSNKYCKFSIDSPANMMNCSSSVNNMTGYRMDDQHFIPIKGWNHSLQHKTDSMTLPASCQVDTGHFLPWVKAVGA
jgi:hypothetical protein